MKKYINKIAIIGSALCIAYSCDTDEKVVDEILAQVGTGAVLRTIDEDNELVFNDETDAFDAGSAYTIVLEEQDEEGGALLESVEIFVNFDDNSEGGTDMSTTEVSLQTLAASDFTTGDRGLPQTTVSYTSDELIAATGIDESLVVGKDRFEFRMVLTLTNGEVYTNTDVGGPVSGGSYFSAPFEYFPVIACSITESLAGTHSYVATGIIPAPGGGGACSGGDLSGTVTWSETDDEGVYTSSDMGFGQFDDCYTGRGPATGEDIEIEWDCTNLSPDGEVYLKEGVVIPSDDDEDAEVTYSYTITNVSGADMTIEFANSAGDRGTVVLTREGNVDWPVIFTANND
ncbi:hypothetical protein [Costertonia aggregata]|uniref:Uncharacterized protein n=1 Tax=Costertonia aggregata TaxID=343403 RepID=A0A7H9ARP4_9FLAO|nr:hypothetical protein [Costertonia aggregata]QLG46077.1 hypothetical protein HYG79_12210 [Costertonia aggregata]